MGSAETPRVRSLTLALPCPGEFTAGLVDIFLFLPPAAGEGRAKREDGPASGRGPPGHAGSAAHAQACRAERGPGEDPAGEPPAAGATPGAPPLTLLHFAPAVATELPAPPQTDASQQQHPQTEAVYRGTHMVGLCLPSMWEFFFFFFGGVSSYFYLWLGFIIGCWQMLELQKALLYVCCILLSNI